MPARVGPQAKPEVAHGSISRQSSQAKVSSAPAQQRVTVGLTAPQQSHCRYGRPRIRHWLMSLEVWVVRLRVVAV